MDGNRRWAKEKKLPTFMGHLAGLKQARKIVKHLRNIGVDIVTLYAFSTENWKRSEAEVNYLMKLFSVFVKSNMKQFNRDGGRLIVIGDLDPLPPFLKKLLIKAAEQTKLNTKFTLQVALNYGGRDEIVRAVKRIVAAAKPDDQINEKLLAKYLDTNGQADPDLIIRTSGEQRLSNFLLWQSAYSEMFFAPEYWPDFTTDKLNQIMTWYAGRQRRHGQ
jgi:undecaprenyl diphosphate synthase